MNLAAFRNRILLSATATALLALGMVMLTVSLVMNGLVDPKLSALPPALVAACQADPGEWGDVQIGLQRIRTFADDGRAATGGEPLDVAALAHVPVGALDRVIDRPTVTDRVHVAAAGACAWMVVDSRPPAELQGVFPWALALGTGFAVLTVGIATYWMTVRPLLGRIDQIRAAAVGVGSDGYASANDEVADALADISRGLDRSQARILGDRGELVARHHALEQHLAEIAHDLRTPLHSLLLAIQEVAAAAPEGARPPIRRALQDADYVGTLVENLHHAARLRHGLDPREGETDLRDVVTRLEVRFRALATGVEVASAVPDEPVIVRCNPALAERALANLVQNAVTHGGRHAAIVLSARGESFEVVVLDDGDGLPPAALADLALRTFRDDAARPRGPGLGLAITNEVARRVGWTVRYAPGAEGGLSVTVSGPRAVG